MNADGEHRSPPRDDLLRVATEPDWELRDDEKGKPPTLIGHFARFNEWTEIKSAFEGNFMERIAPGAFRKTLKENGDKIRVLFQHGRDPQIGDKILGRPTLLKEDSQGARYEVPLYDTSYNRDLLPGLRDGAYGASFRFKVIREEYNEEPGKSRSNPDGLPERTITEARVMEFGPVTFPAYASATAGIRSMTLDELTPTVRTENRVEEDDGEDERLDSEDLGTIAQMLMLGTEYLDDQDEPDDQKNVAPMKQILSNLTDLASVEAAEEEPDEEEDDDDDGRSSDEESTITADETAPSHPRDSDPDARRDTRSDDDENGKPERGSSVSISEMKARREEIRSKLNAIAAENVGMLFDQDTQARWDNLEEEEADLTKRIKAQQAREDYLASIAAEESHRDSADDDDRPTARVSDGTGTFVAKRAGARKLPENLFSLSSYHNNVSSQEQLMGLYADGARAALELFEYPHPAADADLVNGHIEELLGRRDSSDKEIAQRVLITGSPTYRSAYWKSMMKRPLSFEEQQALAAGEMLQARAMTTGDTGGVTVPIQIDPTVLPTSNGVLNPFRRIASVETTTSYIWQGVTSAGITAQYRAEATQMTDNAPTLVARPIQPERADAFVPFSWEAGQDWTALEASLAVAIQDAKDLLEAQKFAVGAGHASNEPQGVLVGSGTVVGSSGSTAVAVADVYAIFDALPPRYQGNAVILASQSMFSKIRQLASAAGPNVWQESLALGNPPTLVGYPAYKASTIGTAGSSLASSVRWCVVGDFSRFKIIDRIGLSTRVIPDLFGGTAAVHYPTGQSGLVAYWRNSSGVIDSNAFRVGTVT